MVRAIVGTLVEIGAGRMTPAHIPALSQGRREAAGPTAPAAGLCLARVDYGERRPRLRLIVNTPRQILDVPFKCRKRLLGGRSIWACG